MPMHQDPLLVFSFICNWTYGWVSNRDAGDLRRHRAHYEVIVMRTGNISNVFDITVWVIETLTEHCANNQFIWNPHVSGLRYKYLILDFWISETHSKKALLWRKCAFFSCCQLVCHILRLQIDFTCTILVGYLFLIMMTPTTGLRQWFGRQTCQMRS